MKFSLIVFSLLISACQESATLVPTAFQKKVTATQDAVVLDVRTKEEVEKGVIPGAVNIDFKSESFEEQIKKLDKRKTYFVYCKGGARSSKAADVMKSLGFRKLYQLEGGFDAWKEEGLEVVKK
jgi:phage shock protein E